MLDILIIQLAILGFGDGKGISEIPRKGLVLVPVDTVFEKIREAFSFAKFAYFLRKERSFLEELTEEFLK